ncbi:MAG TPA: hypothetical protein VFE55_02875 [Acidimicrobiia bacterium]|nr:hypothetical protein [Acidimicrobiia bacterium]
MTAVFRRRGAVVYGPYPPIPGAASAATLDTVRRLLAGGADVQVMSPTPSAAHDFADLGQPRGAWRFARRAAGADVLVVYLDAELVASPARRGQLPARTALAAALRSAGHATVHVPAEAEPVPAAWSKVVLAAADEVVVDPPTEDADALSSSASLGGAQPAPDAPAPDGGPAWDLPAEPTREEIEAEVRRRAAERRAARRPAPTPGGASGGRDAAIRALSALPLLGPPPATSARPLASLAKRVIRRLDTWQINPIIEHVNLLHRALIEAAEPRSDPAAGPDGTVAGGSGDGR